MNSESETTTLSISDLAPTSWFTQKEGSSLWITGYRMLRVRQEDLPVGYKAIDLDGVRAILVYGGLRYLDSSQAKIKIESDTNWIFDASAIKHTEAPQGAYLLLLTPLDIDGKEGNEARIRERIAAAVGLLATIGGRNMVYERLYENILHLEDGKLSAFSPIWENPLWFPSVDASDEKVALISDAGKAIAALPASERNRIELSLRWFQDAVFDGSANGFLKYWIALETLGMPDTSDIRPLNERLASVYGLAYEMARDRFKVGRLFGLRSRIVHDGEIVPIHAQLSRYLEALYNDVLFCILNLNSERRSEAVLAQPDFKLEEYLHED